MSETFPMTFLCLKKCTFTHLPPTKALPSERLLQLSCKLLLPCLKSGSLLVGRGELAKQRSVGKPGIVGAKQRLCLIMCTWVINSSGLTRLPDCLSSYLLSKWKSVGLVLWLRTN